MGGARPRRPRCGPLGRRDQAHRRRPEAGWSADDAAILRAVDELYENDAVSEPTWKALGAQFDRKQLLDVLITAGGYRMVSMALNTFGVPLEPDSEPLPSLP